MSKALILYTSVGLGHKSIAENIGYWLKEWGYEVRLEDILEVQNGRLVNFSKLIHAFINKRMPFLWSWLYYSTNSPYLSFLLPLRVIVAKGNAERTKNILKDYQPDIVITTQTTASAILSHLKSSGQYSGLWGIAFSDYHFHRFWYYANADFYLANIPEQKQALEAMGAKPGSVYVCGITLKPWARTGYGDVKNRLKIPSGKKVVLVGTGSQGVVINRAVLEALVTLPHVHTIIACGNNLDLKRELEKAYTAGAVTVLGFYSPMDELYEIADLFITKPGGLSVAEALRQRLPILITHFLPGQERMNFEYLAKHKLIMPQKFSLDAVQEELANGEFRQALRGNPYVGSMVESTGLEQCFKRM